MMTTSSHGVARVIPIRNPALAYSLSYATRKGRAYIKLGGERRDFNLWPLFPRKASAATNVFEGRANESVWTHPSGAFKHLNKRTLPDHRIVERQTGDNIRDTECRLLPTLFLRFRAWLPPICWS